MVALLENDYHRRQRLKYGTYCETRLSPYQDGCRMLGQLQPTGIDAAKLLPVAGSTIGGISGCRIGAGSTQ